MNISCKFVDRWQTYNSAWELVLHKQQVVAIKLFYLHYFQHLHLLKRASVTNINNNIIFNNNTGESPDPARRAVVFLTWIEDAIWWYFVEYLETYDVTSRIWYYWYHLGGNYDVFITVWLVVLYYFYPIRELRELYAIRSCASAYLTCAYSLLSQQMYTGMNN